MLGKPDRKGWMFFASAAMLFAATPVGADETPVDVNPLGDADGQLAGVSVTGDSSGLVAVSVFGDAVATYLLYHAPPVTPMDVPGGMTLYQGGAAAVSGTGDAAGYIAASGTGNADARNSGALTPGGIAIFASHLLGLSGTGDSSGAFAVSGVGEANGDTFGVSGCASAGLCGAPSMTPTSP